MANQASTLMAESISTTHKPSTVPVKMDSSEHAVWKQTKSGLLLSKDSVKPDYLRGGIPLDVDTHHLFKLDRKQRAGK